MKSQVCGLALIAVTLLMVPASQAIGQTGMSINVTTSDGSDIVINGMTTKADPITVKITTQQGNVVHVDQDDPGADGAFAFTARAGIIGWEQDGIYTVNVNQSQSASSSAHNLSVNILVSDGSVTDTSGGAMSSLIGQTTTTPPERSMAMTPGLEFTADAQPGASVITIQGETTSRANDITIIIEAPNGNKVHTEQVTPSSSGQFNADIMIGCPQWEQDGNYMINVQQGSNTIFKKSVDVEISECLVVPEFGAVVMTVLAISIIAIVALTARSRVGIIPRV